MTLIPMLSSATGLSSLDIRNIIRTAPARYKTYRIPKRQGGWREISQPARELKALQRLLLQNVLDPLPIHPAAMAYRAGTSIRDNAAAHAGNGPILKLDFRNFFPSIRGEDWSSYCRKAKVFENEEDIDLSTNILFQRKKGASVLRLAIGAPSSPCLSNIMMFDFDRLVVDATSIESVAYTRYADDLTFSAARTGYLNGVEKTVRSILKRFEGPRLSLNDEKTVLATRKYKRMVTGLIITNDGLVSLGRDRKRKIRAAMDHWKRGDMGDASRKHLAGLISFAQDVEPEYFTTLVLRYGGDTIAAIRKRT